MKLTAACSNEKEMLRAESIAQQLNIELEYEESKPTRDELHLHLDDKGLSLVEDNLELYGDFSRMAPRLKLNNLRGEQIVKASSIKGAEGVLTAIDATAGLGEDSFLLAASGFEVTMYEYNPFIGALLQDALRRAALIPELSDIVGRMHFQEGDSIKAMSDLEISPDIILLDPMFPKRKKSASVKKKFQLLQQLELPCSDETDLLDAAMQANPRKIVIKRPSKGPYLAGITPNYSIQGTGIRYDCFIRNNDSFCDRIKSK